MTYTYDDVLEAVTSAGLRRQPLDGLDGGLGNVFEDYVFWRSPRGTRAFLVAPVRGVLVAVELRPPQRSNASRRIEMCNVCLTLHPSGGVGLWTNRVRGGRVVGEWVCRDFECKHRVAGTIQTPPVSQLRETITPEARHQRMRDRLGGLMARYASAAMEGAR